MLIDFLRATDGTPFTKKFTRTATGEIVVEPFPNVRDVESFREEANSIDELFAHITNHAAQNHCMLKGRLSRPIKGESRAGLTDPHSPTQWLLLDLDFDSGWASVDDFLADLNPAWANVSYIWGHSSSAGIKSRAGLRGHIWLMLESGTIPGAVKLWLKERNLNMPGLKQHLALTATGMSLRWGLDISTCQNDKLIYLAAPMLVDIEDPLTERIVLVKKARDLAPPPPGDIRQNAIDTAQEAEIARLRAASNLGPRTARYNEYFEQRVLTNPDPVLVTGIKQARGFTYLNLNGGDSWGYYHHTENPDLLYNFKDEPLVRLQTVAPEYYATVRRAIRAERFSNVEPYVFRNPDTDQYMNALYSKDEDRLLLLARCSSKDRLTDFLANYGAHLPDPIPDWTVEFDPTTTKIIDPGAKWVNLFDPTVFIKRSKNLPAYPEVPSTVDRVLTHVMSGCQLSKEHFINWLACLLQTRKHLGTAWVFHGVQGTGKGLLLSRILVPLLGSKQVREWTTKDLDDNFNASLEHTCLLWLDEFKVSNTRNPESLMAKLKNLITENTLPVRAMRTDIVERPNFVNVIIASNFPDPISLADNDRRFNVAPAQERPLLISTEEVERLDEELMYFCAYLMNYPANLDKARKVLINDARFDMINASQTSQDAFFSAVRRGDLDYFTGYIAHEAPFDDLLHYQRFENILHDWCRHYIATPDEPCRISRDQLRDVFRYITGIEATPSKFSRMCNMYRVPIRRVYNATEGKFQGTEMTLRADNRDDIAFLLKTKKQSGLRVIKGNKE